MAVAALIQIKWAQTGKPAWQTDRHDTGSGPGRFGVGQRYCASLSRFAAGFLRGADLAAFGVGFSDFALRVMATSWTESREGKTSRSRTLWRCCVSS
jgi:hypothetical protein